MFYFLHRFESVTLHLWNSETVALDLNSQVHDAIKKLIWKANNKVFLKGLVALVDL